MNNWFEVATQIESKKISNERVRPDEAMEEFLEYVAEIVDIVGESLRICQLHTAPRPANNIPVLLLIQKLEDRRVQQYPHCW